MSDRKAGEILDPLGLTLDVDDDQQVTEAVVIARCVSFGEDSRTSLIVTTTPGLDWISQAGLFAAAQQVIAAQPPSFADEDD